MFDETTILLCRPYQLLEAAIVLSCAPTNELPILIVIDSAPYSESEYRKRFGLYKRMRKRNDEFYGNQTTKHEPTPELRKKSENYIIESQIIIKTLNEYRTWCRKQKILSNFISCYNVKTVLLLDEFKNEELHPLDTISKDLDRIDIFPQNVKYVSLFNNKKSADSVDTIITMSWAYFHSDQDFPINPICIGNQEVTGIFIALYQSLASGRPIYVTEDSHNMDEYLTFDASVPNNDSDDNEAVIIEAGEPDAAQLLAVLYAYTNNSKLITYPKLNDLSVQSALKDIENYYSNKSQKLSYLFSHVKTGMMLENLNSKDISTLKEIACRTDIQESETSVFNAKQFINFLSEFFEIKKKGPPFKQLEERISEIIPDRLIEDVGNRYITVLTDNIPYSFISKKEINWANKRIGHIMGDSLLILLNTIFQENAGRSKAAIDLIFDPGFFDDTKETDMVLEELGFRNSYPIVLKGLGSSTQSLVSLSTDLPVKFIYFNTHGSNNAIALSDVIFHDFKIAQWVHLDNQTIIFNNSCNSWSGVGREFIKAGAIAYVGTLWPVNAEEAAEFARITVNRLSRIQ